jgi:hypothetical protein
MADLTPEQREDLCEKHDLTCPAGGNHAGAGTHELRPAPNDKMPNKQHDFRCSAGYLYDAFDLLDSCLD